MFHVKQRRLLGLIAGLSLFGLLAAGCTGANAARGWAPAQRTGDVLLVSTGVGKLDAVDLQGKSRRWRFPNDWSVPEKKASKLHGIYGAPVPSQDGSVLYVGDYNGYVYAFKPGDYSANSESKPKAAALKLQGPVIGGIALDSSGTLFVTAGDRIYAINSKSLADRIGNKDAGVEYKPIFQAKGEFWSTPLLADGKVFVASLDGNLYALDSSGSEVWRFNAGRALSSTPAMSAGTLLVGGFDNKLHAVDASNGREKWAYEASNWVWSRPAVDGSRAYFGDFDGKVYAVDVSNGSLAWSAALDKGAIRASPALARGVLVVATEDGWLFGVDPATQAKRWERDLGKALNADLVVSGDSVLIAPTGCVTPSGTSEKVYYTSVNPENGDLTSAGGVC